MVTVGVAGHPRLKIFGRDVSHMSHIMVGMQCAPFSDIDKLEYPLDLRPGREAAGGF